MTHLKTRCLFLKTLRSLCFLLLLACFVPIAAANDELYFICNENVTTNTLTEFDLKNIFLGKKTTWNDNQKINFVILRKQAPFNIFLKKILHKNSTQYQNYWRHMVFTGQGVLPKSFDTEDELINYVEKTDGAIGYLPLKINTDTVKILKITD